MSSSAEDGAPKGAAGAVLAVLSAAERPEFSVLDRLAREYELRDELDASWAARRWRLPAKVVERRCCWRIQAANRLCD